MRQDGAEVGERAEDDVGAHEIVERALGADVDAAEQRREDAGEDDGVERDSTPTWGKPAEEGAVWRGVVSG